MPNIDRELTYKEAGIAILLMSDVLVHAVTDKTLEGYLKLIGELKTLKRRKIETGTELNLDEPAPIEVISWEEGEERLYPYKKAEYLASQAYMERQGEEWNWNIEGYTFALMRRAVDIHFKQ